MKHFAAIALASVTLFLMTPPALAQSASDVTDQALGAVNDAWDWTAGVFQSAQCYAVVESAMNADPTIWPQGIRVWPDSGCSEAFDEGGGTAWWLG